MEVYVRSILQMKNGESYAVLKMYGDAIFPGDLESIYAEIQKSYTAYEILDY